MNECGCWYGRPGRSYRENRPFEANSVQKPMPLVLDTFNVLHTVGVLPPELAGLDIAGLARLIGESRHRNEKTTLVCDGLPVGEKIEIEPPVTVRFAGRGRTADDLIGQIVRASSAPPSPDCCVI